MPRSKDVSIPEIRIHRFKINLAASLFPVEQLQEMRQLLQKLQDNAMMVKALWEHQQKSTKILEIEVKRLKQHLRHLQAEAVRTKRKRWCCLCEKQATYLNREKTNFFCSKRCQVQHRKLENRSNEKISID